MKETMEVDVERFAFWQAQMAHAAERAVNNTEYDGSAVHSAHEEMKDVLESREADTRMVNTDDATEEYRYLRRECESKDVDVVPVGGDRIHISCNDCGWLHRFIPRRFGMFVEGVGRDE